MCSSRSFWAISQRTRLFLAQYIHTYTNSLLFLWRGAYHCSKKVNYTHFFFFPFSPPPPPPPPSYQQPGRCKRVHKIPTCSTDPSWHKNQPVPIYPQKKNITVRDIGLIAEASILDPPDFYVLWCAMARGENMTLLIFWDYGLVQRKVSKRREGGRGDWTL